MDTLCLISQSIAMTLAVIVIIIGVIDLIKFIRDKDNTLDL